MLQDGPKTNDRAPNSRSNCQQEVAVKELVALCQKTEGVDPSEPIGSRPIEKRADRGSVRLRSFLRPPGPKGALPEKVSPPPSRLGTSGDSADGRELPTLVLAPQKLDTKQPARTRTPLLTEAPRLVP